MTTVNWCSFGTLLCMCKSSLNLDEKRFLPSEIKGPESVPFHHKYTSLQSLPSHCYSPESKVSSNHLDQPIITDATMKLHGQSRKSDKKHANGFFLQVLHCWWTVLIS